MRTRTHRHLRPPSENSDSLEKEEGDNKEGEDKVIKGYHKEKFTLVAFRLLITSVRNEREKMWFPHIGTLTPLGCHTVCIIYCKAPYLVKADFI